MVDNLPHYLMNKGGVYYFTRHVPNDVRAYYLRPRIVLCLKTRSRSSALKASALIAGKLDDFWLQMRVSNMGVPAASLLVKPSAAVAATSHASKLSDALAKYCALRGAGRPKLFHAAAERNIGYVIQCLDDKPVDAYSSSEASQFRDWLMDKGLPAEEVLSSQFLKASPFDQHTRIAHIVLQ